MGLFIQYETDAKDEHLKGLSIQYETDAKDEHLKGVVRKMGFEPTRSPTRPSSVRVCHSTTFAYRKSTVKHRKQLEKPIIPTQKGQNLSKSYSEVFYCYQ